MISYFVIGESNNIYGGYVSGFWKKFKVYGFIYLNLYFLLILLLYKILIIILPVLFIVNCTVINFLTNN